MNLSSLSATFSVVLNVKRKGINNLQFLFKKKEKKRKESKRKYNFQFVQRYDCDVYSAVCVLTAISVFQRDL